MDEYKPKVPNTHNINFLKTCLKTTGPGSAACQDDRQRRYTAYGLNASVLYSKPCRDPGRREGFN